MIAYLAIGLLIVLAITILVIVCREDEDEKDHNCTGKGSWD